MEKNKKIKKTKKKKTEKPKTWKLYVDHLLRKNKRKIPLKDLLKNYSKADYAKFKKHPCVFF